MSALNIETDYFGVLVKSVDAHRRMNVPRGQDGAKHDVSGGCIGRMNTSQIVGKPRDALTSLSTSLNAAADVTN